MDRVPTRARHAHRLLGVALHTPLRRVLGRLAMLEYVSGSGRVVRLPVQYARCGSSVVVAAGSAERKTWWRAFRTPRAAVLTLDGMECAAVGRLVDPLDSHGQSAWATYARAYPLASLDDAALVRFDLP